MGVEIERKFLVKLNFWNNSAGYEQQLLRQAYLCDDADKTIRVRTAGEKGYLTIKGRAKGITRQEFEYTIPMDEANALIDSFATAVVEKIRYFVPYAGKRWEVDCFKGLNEGLWVAELELASEDEAFAMPPWAGEEVTHDPRYLNARLVKHPYQHW
jgi:adenylate cyclase